MSTHHSHHRRSHAIPHDALYGVAAAVLSVLFIAAVIFSNGTTGPFVSSEMRFTDASRDGLEIVPASGGSTPVSPTLIGAQCNTNGTVTLSWNAAAGTERYMVRYHWTYIGCLPAELSWYSPTPNDCYNDWITSTSVTVPIQYNLGYDWWVHSYAGGVTSSPPSSASFNCPAPTPTCSISLNPTTVNQPSASTLSWDSTLADTFYITNISYVTPNTPDSTSVSPSVTTIYTGTAANAYTSTECSATLTVNRSCTFNGNTITHGDGVTAYEADTVPYGSSCVSETRTCSDSTLSGSYAYASCTVGQPSGCYVGFIALAHGETRTFYSNTTTTGGQLCSSISQSRTCDNGTVSGSASYQYTYCSCAASYTCSGSSIIYTDTACSTSTVDTCAAPSYCTPGVSSCVWDPIDFTPSGDLSGHLQARPGIVRAGNTSRLYWDVENAASCTISGGGQSWSTTSSGAGGVATVAINEKTTYTLACEGGGANPDVTETVDVLIQPVFEEQ